MDIWGSVTKIEQNNRQLRLHNSNVSSNGIITSPNYATNLDFQRYENYSAGANVNLFAYDKPDQKYTIYTDFGIKYGHVSIKDSVLTPTTLISRPFNYGEDVHTVTFKLPLIFELLAEKRINIKFSYAPMYTLLFSNNQFKQVLSYAKSDLTTLQTENRARFSNQFETFIKIAPSTDRKTHFFLRFRFYTQKGDANTSFSQLQVGYNYNWSIAR
jgi:hypothetical protein